MQLLHFYFLFFNLMYDNNAIARTGILCDEAALPSQNWQRRLSELPDFEATTSASACLMSTDH